MHHFNHNQQQQLHHQQPQYSSNGNLVQPSQQQQVNLVNVVGRKAGLINEQSAAQFQQQFLYGSGNGNSTPNSSSNLTGTKNVVYPLVGSISNLVDNYGNLVMSGAGSAAVGAGSAHVKNSTTDLSVKGLASSFLNGNGSNGLYENNSPNTPSSVSSSSIGKDTDVINHTGSLQNSTSAPNAQHIINNNNNNTNPNKQKNRLTATTYIHQPPLVYTNPVNAHNHPNHQQFIGQYQVPPQQAQSHQILNNSPNRPQYNHNHNHQQAAHQQPHLQRKLSPFDSEQLFFGKPTSAVPNGRQSAATNNSSRAQYTPPQPPPQQLHQQQQPLIGGAPNGNHVANVAKKSNSLKTSPRGPVLQQQQQQQQQQQNHSILNPTTNVSSQHAEALNPFNGNGVESVPNQRHSKHHHHHNHHNHHQHHPQRSKAPPPPLSISTNNSQSTQNLRQPSSTATANTVSPIQLQNLAHSPSVSDFRVRSRSTTATPNPTTSNSGQKQQHQTQRSSSKQQITPPPIHTSTAVSHLKSTLQNIELKMRIIASPNIRIADLFKCFLKNVPKSTETIESLVHYGDNIGAKIVKCLINENLYESQSLINQDYDIYQGPALCVTYDAILRDEHWDEIFICNDEEFPLPNGSNGANGTSANGGGKPTTNGSASSKTGASSASSKSSTSKNSPGKEGSPGSSASVGTAQQASKFISFFHISDFIAILSGYKVAFVDPYERFAPDERSYVAIFDLEHDTQDIEQFEDQFKPLEKIFNVPLLKTKYYNGTIIRLPLRTQSSTCSVSSKLVHVKDILVNAKDFMKEAHLHILFAKNISNIQFCRTKDNQNIEKIYSINVEDSCVEQFRTKYKKISDAIADGEFPRTSTIMLTLRKQIETKIEKTEWILSIFADTMRLLNSNYFLMKLAIPISDNCDKDIRFSHKSNLISSDTGFIKTLYLAKPIICYIEDKEGILMSHFCRLNISDSLKLSHFNDAYALMLKDLTKLVRKDPSLLWSLMPDIEKNAEFADLLAEIWQEIGKHELFYSCTEGWGYVAIEDMIINDVEDKSVLQEILTKVYSETNYPVVIMPAHVLKALQKYAAKDTLQIMTPSQTSDILHNNVALIEQLKPNQKIELLRYLIKEPASQSTTANGPTTNGPAHLATSSSSSSLAPWPISAARYVLDLPLLLLANQKFVRFQTPNKSKSIFYVEREYMPLFNNPESPLQLSQFINPDLPKDILNVFKKFEFQRLTQIQMISDSELSELLSVPREWRAGDEKISWPRAHEKYNAEWLEMLWKYLTEYSRDDLAMMENLNIVYGVTKPSKTPRRESITNATQPDVKASSNMVLYKLTTNSNLIYTPSYDSLSDNNGSTNGANNNNTTSEPVTTTTTTTTNGVDSNGTNTNNISEETYLTLIKILNKLGFQCLDSISPSILAHPAFNRYVPNLRSSTSPRYDLLRAFRNKYKHASSAKITQDFNALLNEADIKLLQRYLAKIELGSTKSADEERELVDFLKQLPIFENGAIECVDKYIALKDAGLIYDAHVRLPFELPNSKPFLIVDESECKLLIAEKLHLNFVRDFSVIIKEIVKYCATKELNSLPPHKIHALGKWILLNCATYILASLHPNNNSNGHNHTHKQANNSHQSNDLIDCLKNAKLFMNQKQELCAASQFINPLAKDRYLGIFDFKCLPAKDLLSDEKCMNMLKELKMRNCLQLKVDEIIDLYEHSLKQSDSYRRLLAELIIDILVTRIHEAASPEAIEKSLNEYSSLKAVTLRHFLMSVAWIPLQRDRPQSYPQTLRWKGSESTAASTQNAAAASAPIVPNRFSSPRECVDSHFAYCAGSVSFVSNIDVPNELKPYIELKQVKLEQVVMHLKNMTKDFSNVNKVECYDYLTVSKRCYEFMSAFEQIEIFNELKANNLTEWIWNGSGFSSINSIYILTEKDHPLSTHVESLPYELYVFVKFFERLGIKKLPDAKQLEQILVRCVKNTQKLILAASTASPTKLPSVNGEHSAGSVLENAAKNFPFINWIKTYYGGEKKLASIIKDYEESLAAIGASSPFVASSASSSTQSSPSSAKLNGTSSPTDSPTKQEHPPAFDFNSADSIYLYLPEIYKSVEIKDNLINSVATLVKNRQIKILDEEAYLMRKVTSSPPTSNGNSKSSSHNNNNIYDHYRVYNEIILPNLNSLSKNVKDACVLFALDHADPKMLDILRDHPCIPVTPLGRKLRKPNKLVHPSSRLAALYSDVDERFPCGSEDTYVRDDRLQVLKILGMKSDGLTWSELVERADSIAKIREFDVALDRAVALLTVLNDMLSSSPPTAANQDNRSKHMNGSQDEKEWRQRACELIRDIAFIPVKPRTYTKLNLPWYGDKYKHKFAKPKELLALAYEPLCSTLFALPLGEYKKKELVVSKQVEQFLGLDDLAAKFTLRDALKQLDEVAKTNLAELDDAKEVKLVAEMCFHLYEYIQAECQRKPENIGVVREFFGQDRKCILLNEEFVSVGQLCGQLNVNLKPMFFQVPTVYLRSFKFLFNQVLSVRANLDLNDLLHVIDALKRKYRDQAVSNREDFGTLIAVYGLMIEQGHPVITNLYLPNVKSVLLPGRLLYMNPLDHATLPTDRPEDFVHPAVDRRICLVAGCPVKKSPGAADDKLPVAPNSVRSATSATEISSNIAPVRIFPRVFGNKRLEGILARLDDDKINANLVANMDEGNPQIILDYLTEANTYHSLSAYLTDDDVFVILKYFNDFLARNHPGPFNKLKDLKIFKPVWSDKYISLATISNNSTQTLINLTAMNTSQLQSSACLISDEMAALMRRSFKQNPFQVVQVASANGPAGNPLASASNSSMGGSGSGLIILVRRLELAKLYTHLGLLCFNDLEAFLTLCLPHFRKLDAKAQNNFLKYLYEEILEKSYMHERERCFKILREKLYLQTRRGDHQLISDLYDMKSETLKHILTDAHFPDENFDSPQCSKFLKEAGLRTYLPSELCKKCMNEIEQRVANESWSDELRSRSKWLYEHLVENWQRFDDSVLQQRFLEPYCPRASLVTLRAPFEYAEFKRTCLKLSDAELHKYELLVWSSSYLLPAFVTQEALDTNTAEFLKLNRQPCFALVNQHLSNIVESVAKQAQLVSSGDDETTTSASDSTLLEVLSRIYQYLDELSQSEHNKDICKQLEEKEIVWSSTTRKFVAPNKLCIQLDPADEIPPFLFSLSPALKSFKSLFLRLGAKDKPFPMLYGDILRKLAKVCGDDYLNSNELCKALKAMECFFKYLKTSAAPPKNGEDASKDPSNSEYISSQYKLPGLYFVTTELKLEKSSSVLILDNKENIDDISKLPHEKFVFNPTEKVFKISTSEIKPLIDKIFISQRPTLFSQKYEATYDFSLPDDPDSQRQNLLTSLERKYQQIFTSRQLHRSMARCIANEEARRPSPKHLPIDEVEKVIRERLSSIKVTCVEYLETSLAYRKLSNQQKLEQTVEEKACYLTHESSQFATLYVSKKHIEQPYFALCLARALQPLLLDLHFDYSIFTSLIATSVSQMSKLLQLANVASEENILSVIKLQYVPSAGKLYGDDVNLLAQYDTKLHNVLIGDLCVFVNSSGAYIYCQVLKIFAKKVDGKNSSKSSYSTNFTSASSSEEITYEFLVQADDNQTVRIGQKELYVLENWHRIYDAVIAKPPDERESFRYSGEGQYASSGAGRSDESSSSRQQNHRTPGDGEENFSSGQGSDSDRSDTSSTYGGSQENIPSSIELETARNEVNNELRLLFGLDENERKKKINRLLLKWHPDKNQGKEKFASEIFKHLKKQIEAYKNDPFLSNYYRSAYSSYSGFTSATGGSGTGGFGGTSSSRGDDYRSRHYGSFEDLHRSNRAGGAGSPGSGSPHSSPSREGSGGAGASSYDYDSAKGPGPSNLGRAGSFRQEWERRRQQKRQNASGSDPRDRSSPSSARRRGTDFTQMDATLWFTQAKCDMDSANNDMHPITGKPAYEWVCYKCYRAVEKALRAYHYFKGNGKLPASDIHGLLLGVEPSIRDIAFRFCNFISNESSSMQYPGIARFGKTPNEVFPLSKAEQAMDYAKELLKLVEEIIYAN